MPNKHCTLMAGAQSWPSKVLRLLSRLQDMHLFSGRTENGGKDRFCLHFTIISYINFRWIRELNVKDKTILEENVDFFS